MVSILICLDFFGVVLMIAIITNIKFHSQNEIGVFFTPKYKNVPAISFRNYENFPRGVLGKKVEIGMSKHANGPISIKALE